MSQPDSAHVTASPEPLDLAATLRGRKLVVIGGTGFLGKVWWVHLLWLCPDVQRIYLVVRERPNLSPEDRFRRDVATSEVLDPLRDRYGDSFADWLRDKVTAIGGDVSQAFCGLEPSVRDELRGEVDALINAAGVVDFDPPLDDALQVNAFGVQNLCALARDLGDVPLMHTSTCFVAGDRTGFIEEVHPRDYPFPKCRELSDVHWDPDREIAECLDIIEQARHRAGDGFRQSRFLDDAKKNLRARGEPERGQSLADEVEKVRRKFVEGQLAVLGTERAHFWGWPNTYTYTKSIGEQIICASGLPFTIVRPAIIESTVKFPFPGWNEGINTSAPLIYSLREGQMQIPGSDHALDFIPCDMVSGAMTVALAELLEGTAKPVYQMASSDVNPVSMRRMFELSGLYKRKYYQRTGRGGPVLSAVQSRLEGSLLGAEQFESFGPQTVSKGAKLLGGALRKAAVGPAAGLLKPTAKLLEAFGEQQRRVGDVLGQFVPFTAVYDYTFRCDNTRAACARLSASEAEQVNWTPEQIDWREYVMDVHIPALERWVFPQIDERLKRERKAPRRHETLTSLLHEMTERHDLAVALQRTEHEGLSRITFRDWLARSRACAARLQALGVGPGDRVMLAAHNRPEWPITLFGILLAGASAVPVESGIEADVARVLADASKAKVVVADVEARERIRPELGERVAWLDIFEAGAPGEPGVEHDAGDDDVALLIYTSGTTGTPKGVMLTHANVTSLVASLAPLFPLHKGDRVLSVLPLHHTFELTCGLLLPLSRGARVIYLDELSAERLEAGLSHGATAMIGVPALWEMLERRITSRVAEHGQFASRVFDFAIEVNRTLGKQFGIDAGRVLFGPVHEALGGQLRYLVSGGAALPERTHQLFSGVGLHLSEGYGLTEAAPVLTVAEAGPRSRAGHVGKPVPGVEIRIDGPGEDGVGEVLARGPNVMLGYSDDEQATKRTIDEDGWLHTGDLGKLDKSGHLVIVGRKKDVVVTSNGENIYPDDVEARVGEVDGVAELALVGIDDPRGGERLACVAVPSEDAELPRAQRHQRARAALDEAFKQLPVAQRPSLISLIDVPLPRTVTRKVKRREVKRLIERVAPLSDRPPPPSADGSHSAVRAAVAAIARKKPAEITAAMSLRGDLGFDSLMLLELLVALEAQSGATVDAERLNDCHTVGDAEQLLRETGGARRRSAVDATIERDDDEDVPLELPPALRDAAMHWLGMAQMGFYERVLDVDVSGRAFLPHNRNTLVAANHASHLDMGLVKYALGSYGRDIVSLAAQDYFFEGGKWRKAYFDNLTNLMPMSRAGSLRQSLRQAGGLLDEGKTVLIFPEGTRSSTGELQEFKPAVGYLALHHRTDILPVWLGGTYSALPKGATVLRRRDVKARIGKPLSYDELKRLTASMSMSEASRAIARLTERAVRELSRGRVLDTTQLEPADLLARAGDDDSLEAVFRELEQRFVPGALSEPVSYYFSLGSGERWSLRVDAERCELLRGQKIEADCVLKTSPSMFRRIVREAYTPAAAEFVSGEVKSNNIGLLVTFQKAFGLVGDDA